MGESAKKDLIYRSNEVDVRWLNGAVTISLGAETLLLDAPPGIGNLLSQRGMLAGIQSVALSNGRLPSVGGLLPLLCGLEPHRSADTPLVLRLPFGDERGSAVAASWVRGWPDKYPISIDTIMPGVSFSVGNLEVETFPLRMGMPRWLPSQAVEETVGLGWRVQAQDQVIVWLPGAVPSRLLSRICAPADLVIFEVGVLPWPRTEQRWRCSVSEAVRFSGEVPELWLVGDDGGPVQVVGQS
jgi:hypothetical protein